MYMGWNKNLFFIFLCGLEYCVVYTETRNKILFLQIVLHIRKLETAINQTPISSIGRKDPLLFCTHVAYECMALCIMNVKVEKVKGFGIKKPYAIVRATKDDNPLLNAMFGYNNTYIATFNILLTVSQKEIDSDEFDINECFKSFKRLVSENSDNFKCYDFTISELTENLCNSVLIVATKQTMATRRILSLTDKETSFIVAKQAVLSAISKKRYKPLNNEDLEKLQKSETDKENDEVDDED